MSITLTSKETANAVSVLRFLCIVGQRGTPHKKEEKRVSENAEAHPYIKPNLNSLICVSLLL